MQETLRVILLHLPLDWEAKEEEKDQPNQLFEGSNCLADRSFLFLDSPLRHSFPSSNRITAPIAEFNSTAGLNNRQTTRLSLT